MRYALDEVKLPPRRSVRGHRGDLAARRRCRECDGDLRLSACRGKRDARRSALLHDVRARRVRHARVAEVDDERSNRASVHRNVAAVDEGVEAGEAEDGGTNVDVAAGHDEGGEWLDARSHDDGRDANIVVVDVQLARRQTVLAEIVPVAERVKRRDSETLGLVRAKSRMESQFCQREEMEASI